MSESDHTSTLLYCPFILDFVDADNIIISSLLKNRQSHLTVLVNVNFQTFCFLCCLFLAHASADVDLQMSNN